MPRSCLQFFLIAAICLALQSFAPAGQLRPGPDGPPVVELGIHNRVLPEATRRDPMSRANLAVVDAFVRAYPGIVQERYAARYRADPDRYGAFDWSRITVRPRKFTGIKV